MVVGGDESTPTDQQPPEGADGGIEATFLPDGQPSSGHGAWRSAEELPVPYRAHQLGTGVTGPAPDQLGNG